MVGQPADIAPSAYQFRADRQPRENPPESWLALMKCAGLPFDKPLDFNAPALKNVLCGLLWEEVRPVRRVEIVWSADRRRRPEPGELAVTFFDAEAKGIPTWWNGAVLREAGKPEVSDDGRVYTYTIPVDIFGLVVSVRGRRGASAYEVPLVRAFTPEVWKMMDLEIEWGFDKAAAGLDYSGRIEAYDGIPGRIRPLAGDAGTTVSEPCQWRSPRQGDGRRGLSLSLLYLGTSRWRNVWPYNGDGDDVARTIITVWTHSGNFSFLASDLEKGPILAPEYGFFVRATRFSRTQTVQDASGPAAALVAKTPLGPKIDRLLGNPAIHGWGNGFSALACRQRRRQAGDRARHHAAGPRRRRAPGGGL